MSEKIYANMNVVNKLIEIIPDWANVVIPRHVKFIKSYENSGRNLSKAGMDYNYSKNDMLSIFLRIERTLKAEYDKRVKEGKIKKVNLYYSNNKKIIPITANISKQIVEKASSDIKELTQPQFNIDGVTDIKQQQILDVLKVASNIKNISQIVSPSHVAIIEDLLKGINFSKVLDKYGRSRDYTFTILLGKKNPRSKSEEGLLATITRAERDGKVEYYKKPRQQIVKVSKKQLELFELIYKTPNWKQTMTDKQIHYIEAWMETSLEEAAQKFGVAEQTIKTSLLSTQNYSALNKLKRINMRLSD